MALRTMMRWALVNHGFMALVVPGVLAVIAKTKETMLESSVALGGNMSLTLTQLVDAG
jgi:ABC-type cobalamin transport system permease subunit